MAPRPAGRRAPDTRSAPAQYRDDATEDDAGAVLREESTTDGTFAVVRESAFVDGPSYGGVNDPLTGPMANVITVPKISYDREDADRRVTIVGNVEERFFAQGAKRPSYRLRYFDGQVVTKAEAESVGATYRENR